MPTLPHHRSPEPNPQPRRRRSVCSLDPGDFADIAGRAAIDKTLQRLATNGELRRIDRGLYDRPSFNRLTGKPTVPNYQAVIRAVARRDNARFVVDGMTAANDLGLTTAVPAKIEVLVDARMKPIKLGKQKSASNMRQSVGSLGRASWNARCPSVALATGRLIQEEERDE